MAKPTKHRPWVVQISVACVPGKWYGLDAYRDQDTALVEAALAQQRLPGIQIRVIDWREGKNQ